jgi:hypothetical protein
MYNVMGDASNTGVSTRTECLPSCDSKNVLKISVIIFPALLGVLGSVVLPIFIFGEKSFLISRYYSASTLHLHRITTRAAFPNQWNSLGPITPYYGSDDRQYTQRVRQPTPYFVYDAISTFYVNGESLSILSNISPAVYLATLVVICCLSLVYFVFAMANPAAGEKKTICSIPIDHDKLLMAKNVCSYIVLLVYFLFVFLVFVTSGTTRSVAWGTSEASMTVEYKISSHIPSLSYCIIVLAMYYLHLMHKDPYWEHLFFAKQAEETAPQVAQPQWVMPENLQDKDPGTNTPGTNTMFGDRLVHNSMQMQRLYTHSNQVPTFNTFQGKTQQVLMNSSGRVISDTKYNEIAGDKREAQWLTKQASSCVQLFSWAVLLIWA